MLESITDSGFWLLLSWIFISPVICFFQAHSKNRSSLFWVIAGLVFGFISVIVLYFLPKKPGKKYTAENNDRIDSKLNMYGNLKELEKSRSK
jgi:multisubunit Na+/H+ antiporter MnhB subunit